MITPELIETLCEIQHDAYEGAATREGWATQEASRKPWSDVPEANKRTMRAAVRALLESLPETPAADALEAFAAEVCDVNAEQGMTAEARHFGRAYARLARDRAAGIRDPESHDVGSDRG
jgi:hypothetical protein